MRPAVTFHPPSTKSLSYASLPHWSTETRSPLIHSSAECIMQEKYTRASKLRTTHPFNGSDAVSSQPHSKRGLPYKTLDYKNFLLISKQYPRRRRTQIIPFLHFYYDPSTAVRIRSSHLRILGQPNTNATTSPSPPVKQQYTLRKCAPPSSSSPSYLSPLPSRCPRESPTFPA